jgi:hypothetical protein
MSMVQPHRAGAVIRPVRVRATKRNRNAVRALLASARDLWNGDTWEPGHDWLTRVESGEPSKTR